jgi:hypothetical protein
MNGTNKLEGYFTLVWKSLLGTNTLAYGGHLYVMKKIEVL